MAEFLSEVFDPLGWEGKQGDDAVGGAIVWGEEKGGVAGEGGCGFGIERGSDGGGECGLIGRAEAGLG